MERRRPESEVFILPQRGHADIVVQFSPAAGDDNPPDTPLSAELLLRPTVNHPDLTAWAWIVVLVFPPLFSYV